MNSDLKSIKTPDRFPKGIIYGSAFKLMGTPLSFCGSKKPDLYFCSHMDEKIPLNAKRVLGNSLTLTAVNSKNKNQDILALDYERTFSFGRMDLKLLPAGLSPGSSMLEIKFNDMTIIYCNALRLANPIAGEKASKINCDILLLDTPITEYQLQAPVTVKTQLLKWVNESLEQNQTCSIVCSNKSDAFNTVSALFSSDIPVYAHKSIYEMLRDTGYLALNSASIEKLNPKKWPENGAIILPFKAWNSTPKFLNKSGSACAVGEKENKNKIDKQFVFGNRESLKVLIAFARSTGTKAVALGSAYTTEHATMFRKAGFTVYYSKKPVQLALPLIQ
ncbi:MAG: hypothetical protein JXR91_03295 [Deltaproteobacteria bacterium]|nr:hypothetical protein [Deltaproteobacteria bacterium]